MSFARATPGHTAKKRPIKTVTLPPYRSIGLSSMQIGAHQKKGEQDVWEFASMCMPGMPGLA